MNVKRLFLLVLLTVTVGADAETNVVARAFTSLSTYLRGPVASSFAGKMDARCRTVASADITILDTRPAGFLFIVR